jgi:hypothetical protein
MFPYFTYEENMIAINTLAYYITAKQGFIVQATGGSPFLLDPSEK